MNLSNYVAGNWVLSNPVIFYRAIRGFFRALVLKKNTLKTIELFPTFDCPANCPMCSVEKYKIGNAKPMLTLEDYERLADEGAKLGAIAATILGGEPLVYPHLKELMQIFKKRNFFINIVSNGLLLSKEKLEDLKSYGLNSMFFSLESMDEEVNDSMRGKGHFAKTMQNVKWCQELKLVTGLAPVFFPDRMEDAVDVIDYAHRNGMCASGGQVAATGLAEQQELLSPEQHDFVRSLLKKYPRLTFDWSLSYFLKIRCPAGKEKIGITCHGDVIGCSVNPISFGNVMEEPLANIWKRMGKFSQFANDSKGCLGSENLHYIKNYLAPAHKSATYPFPYTEHPLMTPEHEPKLYENA